MNERIHEQISAFLDDELPAEESAFLVRRLTSDTLAHQQTVRYAAIGSVLRRESPLANSGVLRERIQAVLDGAPTSHGPVRPQSPRSARWVRMVAGLSVAASVAVAALLGLRTMVGTEPTPVSASAVVPGTWEEPSSYVVPGDSARALPVATAPLPIELTNLLVEHGQFASSVARASVQSSAISNTESESTELAEDEAP